MQILKILRESYKRWQKQREEKLKRIVDEMVNECIERAICELKKSPKWQKMEKELKIFDKKMGLIQQKRKKEKEDAGR